MNQIIMKINVGKVKAKWMKGRVNTAVICNSIEYNKYYQRTLTSLTDDRKLYSYRIIHLLPEKGRSMTELNEVKWKLDGSLKAF